VNPLTARSTPAVHRETTLSYTNDVGKDVGLAVGLVGVDDGNAVGDRVCPATRGKRKTSAARSMAISDQHHSLSSCALIHPRFLCTPFYNKNTYRRGGVTGPAENVFAYLSLSLYVVSYFQHRSHNNRVTHEIMILIPGVVSIRWWIRQRKLL
jgi:hypothetical protein